MHSGKASTQASHGFHRGIDGWAGLEDNVHWQQEVVVAAHEIDAPPLKERLHAWRDAGIITRDQADQIEQFEIFGQSASPRRLSLATEVTAYVGSVLAIMGGITVVGSSWDSLSFSVRLAVGVAVVAVGFGTGTWLARIDEAGMQRLGRFLWAIGTGGVALSALAIMTEVGPDDEALVGVVVGTAVLVVSAVLWRNDDRPLQLLTAAIGFSVTLAALSAVADSPMWVSSGVLLVLGAALGVGAALGRIQPRMMTIAIGSVAAYVGGFMLSDISDRLGTAAALAVAVVVVAFGLRERLVPILVMGVIGALIATQGLLATTIEGAASALVVTAIGLVIVVVAIVRGVRSSDEARDR